MLPVYYDNPNKIKTTRYFSVPLRLVIVLWLTLVLVIFLGIAVSRARPRIPIPEIVSYLLPGQPQPKSASCDEGDAVFWYIAYCSVYQEGAGQVYFTYDQRIQSIRSTFVDPNGLAIGDLIPIWGNPQSYSHDSGKIQVYWGRKLALLSGPLVSTTQVKSIIYRLDNDIPQDSLLPWRGFVNVDFLPAATSIIK